MNQILENQKSKILNKKFLLLEFLLFISIPFFIIINHFKKIYLKNNEKIVSDTTKTYYSVMELYSDNDNSLIKSGASSTFIIGKIEIPILNISYPIFSDCTDELLKISVCKFWGPSIGEIGNLCIAGHNYDNNTFFSNLYLLRTNDIINIYNENSDKFTYEIYKKYEISPDDMNYLSQETYRKSRINLNNL